MRLDHVVLHVADPLKSAEWYHDVVGRECPRSGLPLDDDHDHQASAELATVHHLDDGSVPHQEPRHREVSRMTALLFTALTGLVVLLDVAETHVEAAIDGPHHLMVVRDHDGDPGALQCRFFLTRARQRLIDRPSGL